MQPIVMPAVTAFSTFSSRMSQSTILCVSAPRRPLHFQALSPDRLVGHQRGGRALEHDAPVAHHVQAMGDLERDRELLLDEQDGDATACDLVEELGHLLD